MALRINFSSRCRARLLAAGLIACFTTAAVEIQGAPANTTKPRSSPAKATQAAKAAAAKQTPDPAKSYDIEFREFRLKNGLRVLLAEDHSAPTYSICVTYNVGSRDERPGRTGFAHLFEHMLFQGSENVGKGEHFILIQNNGGSANGTTNMDRNN